MVSQSARTPESLAIPSHHSPLQTVHKKHENHWRCVPIYQRLAPRLGCRVRALLLLLVVFLSCSSLAAPALVTRAHGDRSVLFVEDDLGSALHPHLTHHPKAPRLMPPLQGHDAIRSSPPSKRALGTDPNASSGDFSVPAAFDSALSNNFTNACAKFLNNMRQNEDFKNCHPFSLLLQTSSSFFDASKSTLRITQTLDATCGASAPQCKPVMDKYATEILLADACKADYESDNPMVIQAYNGLVAYLPSYQASCLHGKDGNYCFASAVTNTTSPGDAYPYYLPVGQELPAGSRPTCNSCLKSAMGVFASYSNNASQPLAKTYASAAHQISIACGTNFLDVTAAPIKSAAPTTSVSLTPTITLVLMFLLYFFQ